MAPDETGFDDDSPREACGVVGIYAPGQPIAHLSYLSLYALQHRGQESAGIATSDGERITVVKDMGLVSNVFNDHRLKEKIFYLAKKDKDLIDLFINFSNFGEYKSDKGF